MSTYVYLAHHGIKGQKWGIRRYENPDGTLTEAGRLRYNRNQFRGTAKATYKDLKQQVKAGTLSKDSDKFIKAKNENILARSPFNKNLDSYMNGGKLAKEKAIKKAKIGKAASIAGLAVIGGLSVYGLASAAAGVVTLGAGLALSALAGIGAVAVTGAGIIGMAGLAAIGATGAAVMGASQNKKMKEMVGENNYKTYKDFSNQMRSSSNRQAFMNSVSNNTGYKKDWDW